MFLAASFLLSGLWVAGILTRVFGSYSDSVTVRDVFVVLVEHLLEAPLYLDVMHAWPDHSKDPVHLGGAIE